MKETPKEPILAIVWYSSFYKRYVNKVQDSLTLVSRSSLSLFAFASFYQRIFQLARCSLPRKFSTKKVINYRCSLFGETKITKYFIIINFLKLKTSFLRAYMLMHKLVPICRVQCFSENIL